MNVKHLMLGFAILLLVACSNEEASLAAITEIPALPDGAYLLKDVEVTESGEVSVLLRDQIKIYTNNRFMFAFMHKELGVDAGAGIATWKNGIMIEEPIVNHNGPLEGLSFDVAIEQTDSGFIQSIKGLKYEDGRSLDMIETWDTASTDVSPFDGLWQLESASPTALSNDFAEIKMIGGGHFIWTNRFMLDGERQKNFGFGKIDFGSDGQATEVGMISSIDGYNGTQRDLNMTLIDDNHFSQTFTMNGTAITHRYTRM